MCICGNIALWNAYGTTDPIKTDQPRIGDKFWWRNTFWCPVYRWCPHRHTAHQYWWGKILAGRILCPRDIRPGRHKYMHRVRNGSFLHGRSPPRPMHIRCHFMHRHQLPAGAAVNVFMTSDDVNTYIPPTDITQWAKISCCSTYAPGGALADSNIPDSLNNKNTACADGIIGPGTYLFVARYPTTQFDTSDCMTATPGLSNAFVAVFDHAVGHRIIHGNNVFQHFVDVNNAPYQSWTISTAPVGHWLQNTNQTNVSNIPAQATGLTMCVFELK